MKTGEKWICIKQFIIEDPIGVIKSYNIGDIIDIFNQPFHDSKSIYYMTNDNFYLKEGEIENNFITLSKFREKRIEELFI